METQPASARVDVLEEILQWSESLPNWQRDALRRLVTAGSLESADVEQLAGHCKATHGLGETSDAEPLERRHLPQRTAGAGAVSLISLTHEEGVNALADRQTLAFGRGLTIVYGPNAAGKSGYTRILKRACRARGAEEILGNVFSSRAPGRPMALLRFSVGDSEQEYQWVDQRETAAALGQMRVFDAHSAAVYLRDKTDVAFRPLGLDLFDRLAAACQEVEKALDKERRALEASQPRLPELPEGTAAFRLVARITALTKPEEVSQLATLSEGEKGRLVELGQRLRDLQASDPAKLAKALRLRATRLESLAVHLQRLEEAVGDAALVQLERERTVLQASIKLAAEMRLTAFPPDLLPGSGGDRWRDLWEAARRYSIEDAYPGNSHPVTGAGTLCLLCQQALSEEAALRLKGFEEFLRSTVQQDVDRATTTVRELQAAIQQLPQLAGELENQVADLRLETEELAAAVDDALASAAERRARILAVVSRHESVGAALPALDTQFKRVEAEAASLRQRGADLLNPESAAVAAELSRESAELAAREALKRGLSSVLAEIARKQRLAAYRLCQRDTNTRVITLKSADLTLRAVTQRLSLAFLEELDALGFTHLEVEIQPVGGERGALYHKLHLKRAAGAHLPSVVSEGEARVLAVAAFFSELRTATDRSAIVFDDPVSSLDHSWRDNVATRLAYEAQARQVIVFTHDIVFLLALVGAADRLGIEYQHQWLRREPPLGAGVASPELPWVALKVKARIGILKNAAQEAGRLWEDSRVEYERETLRIYGLLREAWERGLEEVLLGGIVERYRPSVQTQHVNVLADIQPEDCRELEEGMAKCSRWVHDRAAAEASPVPAPPELQSDIEAFEAWVTRIKKRRT